MTVAADKQFTIYNGDGVTRPNAVEALPTHSPLHAETGQYLADPELAEAVNIALCVSQPLLVTGEPGCGKTRLAHSIAHELGLGEPLVFYTRSTSRAQDLLYTFDSVRRFHDIQIGDARAAHAHNYVTYEALGQSIVEQTRRVVLIDEIDKAPRDFPNDLLNELDRMEFKVHELNNEERLKRTLIRPIVVITSNSERQLPLPFLRRCVFHYVNFPNRDKLIAIVKERLGHIDLNGDLLTAAVDRFTEVRAIKRLTKRPATGELLAWVLALHERSIDQARLLRAHLTQLPLWQALIKDRDDYRLLQEHA